LSGLRLTIRHSFDFGCDRLVVGDDLVRPEAWDALRTETHGPFAIAPDRGELERTADARPEIEERARQICARLDDRGIQTLASYGVGGAVLELWLQRFRPETALSLTDYAPETVTRLRELFPGATVESHDVRTDPPLEADLHLFHRIDTELTNGEWRQVLRRFDAQTILVVATEVADLDRVARELVGRLRNRRLTRAGWLRTREAFEALWPPTHEATPMRLYDLDAWLLEPRTPARLAT
jgi:hypothetical protein